MRNFTKPRIFISKCLGFEKCRYDGSVINDPVIPQFIGHFDFVTVCPEKEIGLGVPRDPIRIVEENEHKHLFQPATGNNVTTEMEEFTENYLGNLGEVDGFIMKHRSPSCGLNSVKIYMGFNEKINHYRGEGFFGGAVMDKYPRHPIEDEGRLRNFLIREQFLTQVFTLAEFRKLKKKPVMKNLVQFHAQNKFLFMAYHQDKMRILGKITANHEKKPVDDVFAQYEDNMLELFQHTPKFTSWINVLQHTFGFISDKLTSEEKQFFLNTMEEYRDERIPLSVLLKLLHSWAIRFESEYLMNQTFLNPFPKELVEITDSGKGRNR